jgi:hypothetical protein
VLKNVRGNINKVGDQWETATGSERPGGRRDGRKKTVRVFTTTNV